MFEIRVDLTEFRAAMRRNVAAIPATIKTIIARVGLAVERGAKQELYPGHGKLTGRLRGTIRTEISGGGIRATVGPHTHYAGDIEARYQYMQIGACKASGRAQAIARHVMQQRFGS